MGFGVGDERSHDKGPEGGHIGFRCSSDEVCWTETHLSWTETHLTVHLKSKGESKFSVILWALFKINEKKSVQFVGKGEKGIQNNTEHQSLKERQKREPERRGEERRAEPSQGKGKGRSIVIVKRNGKFKKTDLGFLCFGEIF
ncbi:hypothetical protein NE237_004401 [Protea cynaroides]|uniref:Uncharacterized protein n=1 Tax=Protea cynaroides TaxID=273540 RepID=A0A9Q0KIQ0_9MAGN|nr:hypothetical protein NE237_004401 [Protea cynaroides]